MFIFIMSIQFFSNYISVFGRFEVHSDLIWNWLRPHSQRYFYRTL